jgi:hypothetical protein
MGNSGKNGAATATDKKAVQNGTLHGAVKQAINGTALESKVHFVKPGALQNEADKILQTETGAAKVEQEHKLKFSVENQKERNRKLNSLFEKHAKLSESRENLADFNVSSESHLNRLELSDNKGSEFKTNNPVVIAKVIQLLMLEIETNLQNTEREIEGA